MDRAIFRILVLIGTIFAIGCCCMVRAPKWVRHPTPCDSQPHDHEIEVSGGKVSCDTAYLSKNAQHHVEWYSPEGKKLSIQFPSASPFRALTCQNNLCQGFDINVDPNGPPYKYEVWVDDKRILDPNIIIMP